MVMKSLGIPFGHGFSRSGIPDRFMQVVVLSLVDTTLDLYGVNCGCGWIISGWGY